MQTGPQGAVVSEIPGPLLHRTHLSPEVLLTPPPAWIGFDPCLLITVSIIDYCFLDPFWTPKRNHYPCVKPHEYSTARNRILFSFRSVDWSW